MQEYTILLRNHDGVYIGGVGYKVKVSEDINPIDLDDFKTSIISYLDNFQNLKPYLSRAGELENTDPNNRVYTLNINQDPEVRNMAMRMMNENDDAIAAGAAAHAGGNINDIRSKNKRRKSGYKLRRSKSKRRKSKRRKSKTRHRRR